MAAGLERRESILEKIGIGSADTSEDEGVIDPDAVVHIDNVHKTYLLGVEGVPALRGVSLTVKRGEFVIIYGTSGGGKTSLLNIIGTIDTPTKGELTIVGTRITSATKDTVLANIRQNRIGFVFQTFNLLGSLTALENVMMPMILRGVLSRAERIERATYLLERVGMGARLGHFPSMLSGGEQQRVTIARAVANNPELLLLDEPTGDLDQNNSKIVLKLLCDLNKNENITLVMVTHDVGLKPLANRVVWMRDGKINRIETTEPSRRAEELDKLEEEVAQIGRDREAAAAAARAAAAVVDTRHTSVRHPSHYPMLNAVTTRKGRKLLGKRMADAGLLTPDGAPSPIPSKLLEESAPKHRIGHEESSSFTSESSRKFNVRESDSDDDGSLAGPSSKSKSIPNGVPRLPGQLIDFHSGAPARESASLRDDYARSMENAVAAQRDRGAADARGRKDSEWGIRMEPLS